MESLYNLSVVGRQQQERHKVEAQAENPAMLLEDCILIPLQDKILFPCSILTYTSIYRITRSESRSKDHHLLDSKFKA